MLRPRLSGLRLAHHSSLLPSISLRLNAEAAIERIETATNAVSSCHARPRLNAEAAIERIETSRQFNASQEQFLSLNAEAAIERIETRLISEGTLINLHV